MLSGFADFFDALALILSSLLELILLMIGFGFIEAPEDV